MDFIDTPEPIIGRPKANAVTFKDHKFAPSGDATATFTVGQASKSGAAPIRWQQESFCLLSNPAAMPSNLFKQDMHGEDALHVRDVLQWKTPALSALVLLGGGFCALAGEFILRGDHTVTPLKAMSYLVLGDLAVNTLRSMVSAQWQDKAAWSTSSAIAAMAEGAKQVVFKVARGHDDLLAAKDPVLTLRLAGGLCLLALLSNIFSMWRLICLAFFGAFAWGVTWDMYGVQISSHVHKAIDALQERWQALKLSRRSKAAALAAASLCIWTSTGWTMRLQVLLLGALTVRCNLKPAEVDAIITRAEPYMHSAKKRARRLSVVASDYVRRHSFGPAQAKAHET
ncbi:hypothetical protein CVIRNUC_003726 [Coccomyxa viridis]|uniref:Reticulon-like protein n=1 Tax=Coccomyxa viridis TaxID=1274662 RepID=A0AAV1I130_9CHLO|nr:hypothetical protein CVIRNUC_003726 [Coccomyxa viridis]